MLETQHLFLRQGKFDKPGAQVPGKLFSPSDISKKLSHQFLLHFWIDMGSYDQHSKCQGVYGASIKQFFHKGPHLNSFKIFFIQSFFA